ncbi:MAG: sigma-E processing peptidase SpoIIGA [Syntrophomonadaceae bacterium]
MTVINEPKVYADITFLINFLMDFIILWASARLVNLPVKYGRLLIAAIIGAFYAVGYVLPDLTWGYNWSLKILVSAILVYIGLNPDTFQKYIKGFTYFYAINFLVAGTTIGLSYLVSNNLSSDYFIWLIGGITVALWIGYRGENILVNRIIPALLKYPLEVRIENRQCAGQGFLDTGNGLRDPLTNRPVIIAEYQWIKDLLPDDFITVYETQNKPEDMFDLMGTCWSNRLRIIPFSSIGKKNGWLVGVRTDEITLNNGRRQITHNNLVVALYREQLSSQGEYQLLIPGEILEKG